MRALTAALLGWCAVLAVACRPGPVAPPPSPSAEGGSEKSPGTFAARRPPPPVRIGSATNPAGGTSVASQDNEMSVERAVNMAWTAISELADYTPTLVVWLFDETPSAQELVSRASARLKENFKSTTASLGSTGVAPAKFASAVAGYGADLRLLLEKPTQAAEAITTALDNIRVDSSNQERLFAALEKILDRYLSQRASGGKLVLCIVTDEMGDDWEEVDRLVPRIRREAVAVYVIGPPAPLGKVQVVRHPTETPSPASSLSTYVPHRQGPESRFVELVPFQRGLEQSDVTLLDSGFGPFALEWICRVGGGSYLAIRPRYIQGYVGLVPDVWPSPYVPRFPADVMQAYTPDYVSHEDYQRLLAANAAARALHEAARTAMITTLNAPQLSFAGDNEAELNRVASEAQKQAALAIRSVDEVYNLLRSGEKDRPQLRSPRWQAAYDLAYGQASLAKARIDGYNSMLAKLKRGMKFTNPSSKEWLLEPADEFPESSLQTIAERGRAMLEQVVKEHPQTPWALIAQESLRQPVGWRWTERAP